MLVLMILTVMNQLESILLTSYRAHTLKATLTDRPGIINDLRENLGEYKIKVVSLNASMTNKETLKLEMVIRKPSEIGMDKVINIVSSMDEAQTMSLE